MTKYLKLKLLLIFILLTVVPQIIQAQEIATIQIPILEVEANVVPVHIRQLPHAITWDTRRLYDKVGYLTGTGWFGENKNVVLGGHAETVDRQPNIFFNLHQLQIGDVIHVHANGTTYHYAVASLEWVIPTDLSSVLPTGHDQLTLITCDSDSFDGTGYEKRLVVRALPA